MAGRRALSLKWELDIDGQIVIPVNRGEFSEGMQGMIEVVDGEIGYSIPDGVEKNAPVEVVINITEDKAEYNIMQAWTESKLAIDVYVIGRNGRGEAVLQFLYEETLCVHGNHSASDRKSPSEETKTYTLAPFKVSPIK